MRLRSGNTEVSLEVRGWEFPGEDWLLIALEAKTSDGSWSAVDPCLTRSEAARLGDWLGAIADGKAPRPTIEFIEPELALEYRGQSMTIWLEYRLRPPWKPTDPDVDDRFGVTFDVSIPDLQDEVRDWRRSLVSLRRP